MRDLETFDDLVLKCFHIIAGSIEDSDSCTGFPSHRYHAIREQFSTEELRISNEYPKFS